MAIISRKFTESACEHVGPIRDHTGNQRDVEVTPVNLHSTGSSTTAVSAVLSSITSKTSLDSFQSVPQTQLFIVGLHDFYQHSFILADHI